ncbi:MAG: DUF4363 family protein [Clostridiales bacterium]|nr:DUF4363 family protein [Clostridiales bacterium]
MKRIWFAIGFLAIAVLLCTYEQLTIKSAYYEINSEISQAQNAQAAADKQQYALDAAEIWNDYYKKISLFSNHSVFEGIDLTFKMISEYSGDDANELDELIAEAKSELSAMYDSAKISFSNVF